MYVYVPCMRHEIFLKDEAAFDLSRSPDEESGAEEHLDCGCAWNGEAQDQQRTAGDAAQQQGHQKADAEGTDQPLNHDEESMAAAVEVAHTAEYQALEQAVDAIGFEVVRRSGDDSRVLREDPARRTSPWKKVIQATINPTARKTGYRTAGPARPGLPARADVLGHKGGHRLHVGRRHDHQENAHLAAYAYAGGHDRPHGIGDGDQNQKRNIMQQVLKGPRAFRSSEYCG